MAALGENLIFIKGELQAVRAEVTNSILAFRVEVDQVRMSVKEVADGISNWSNKAVDLRGTVTELDNEWDGLKKKYEAVKGHMREGVM